MSRYQMWLALGRPDLYDLWLDGMFDQWAKECGKRIAPFADEPKSYRYWWRWRLMQPGGQEAFDVWLAARFPSKSWTLGISPDGKPTVDGMVDPEHFALLASAQAGESHSWNGTGFVSKRTGHEWSTLHMLVRADMPRGPRHHTAVVVAPTPLSYQEKPMDAEVSTRNPEKLAVDRRINSVWTLRYREVEGGIEILSHSREDAEGYRREHELLNYHLDETEGRVVVGALIGRRERHGSRAVYGDHFRVVNPGFVFGYPPPPKESNK